MSHKEYFWILLNFYRVCSKINTDTTTFYNVYTAVKETVLKISLKEVHEYKAMKKNHLYNLEKPASKVLR